MICESTRTVLRDGWLIAADAENRGLDERWYENGLPDTAVEAVVPSLVHMYFPDCYGVAWYSLSFVPEFEKKRGYDCLLRFGMAEFKCDVYLNGTHIGCHLGCEDPFEFEVTKLLRFGEENRLVVRLSKPHEKEVDGFKLKQIPHRNQCEHELCPGMSQNVFGLREEVSLLNVPRVHISDAYIYGDIATGSVMIAATVRNSAKKPRGITLSAEVGDKRAGIVNAAESYKFECDKGGQTFYFNVPLSDITLWSPENPFLYFVNLSLECEYKGRKYRHTLALRTAFRDFRVDENGYFSLNGKRVFLRCSHTGNNFPVGIQQCLDPYLMRRDFDMAKASGLNCVRFISGYSQTEQLDYCDEIGMMVYQEPSSSWLLEDGERTAELYLDNLFTLIKRDRSHPSIVIWGLLNETPHSAPFGMAFDVARDCLPRLRELDNSRLVLLSSGRFDGHLNVGSFANPGSDKWQCEWNGEDINSDEQVHWLPGYPGAYFNKVGDLHCYPTIPHSREDMALIRDSGAEGKALFISEYGVGSMFDTDWLCRKFEQLGTREDAPDYRRVKQMNDGLCDAFVKYGLDKFYAFPSDILRESALLHARQRALTFDLVRSNPRFNGYSITGLLDHAICGEGLWTLFREWKPTICDTISDGFAPLKWCLFVNPTNIYRGHSFSIEGVLADEDILASRDYEVVVKIVGNGGVKWEKSYTFTNHAPRRGLSIPVFKEEISPDLPEGEYLLRAEITEGAAATCSSVKFYVTDLSSVHTDARLYSLGLPENVTEMLTLHGAAVTDLDFSEDVNGLILVGHIRECDRADISSELYRLIEKGARAVIFDPSALPEDDAHVARYYHRDWLYHKEYIAKPHPYFDGLPRGRIMDLEFYTYIINGLAFDGGANPDETAAVCVGTGINASATGYEGGFNIGRYNIGEGAMIVNSFELLGQAQSNPACDRIILNIVAREA